MSESYLERLRKAAHPVLEPNHNPACAHYLADPQSCTCGLDAMKARIAELERTEHKVSDVREAIAYRLEKVWGEDPVMIADLLSWEWHKPSYFIQEMRRDLDRYREWQRKILDKLGIPIQVSPEKCQETILDALVNPTEVKQGVVLENCHPVRHHASSGWD